MYSYVLAYTVYKKKKKTTHRWMQSWVQILKKTIISEIQAEIVNMTSYPPRHPATLTLSSDRHLNALCRIYVDQVGNQLLQSFPTKQPVLGLAEVDFSLVENPLFTASSLSFFCKGEVYSLTNPVVRPLALLPPFHSLPSH